MPGARKSRVSKDRAAQRRYAQRRAPFFAPRPVIVIAPDDGRTAGRYFNEIKRLFKDRLTVLIVSPPHDGANPDAVVRHAQKYVSTLTADAAHDEHDRHVAYALIDVEHEPHLQRQAFLAEEQHRKSTVHVLLSKPCFELWTLLHFEDTGRSFDHCEAVRSAVKTHWQRAFGVLFEVKAQADYAKIMPFVEEASRRARRHCEPTRDPSWTRVYIAIDEILRLAGQGAMSS